MTPSEAIDRSPELARLLRFITADATGFGLAIATYGHVWVREDTIGAAVVATANAGRIAEAVDLSNDGPDTDLLSELHLATQPPSGRRPDTLLVVGFEHFLLDLTDKEVPTAAILALNFVRDSLPQEVPAKTVLWLRPAAAVALGREVPDLADVVLTRFNFEAPVEALKPEERQTISGDFRMAPPEDHPRLRREAKLLEDILKTTPAGSPRRIEIPERLGAIHVLLGEPDVAMQWYEREAEAASEANDLASVGRAKVARGDIANVRGQVDLASNLYHAAIVTFEKLGDLRSRTAVLARIANRLEEQGKLDEALRIRREEMLPVFEHLGDARQRAITMGGIAEVLRKRGEIDDAWRLRTEEILPIFMQLGDRQLVATEKARIADILRERGDMDEALRVLREDVLPVTQQFGDATGRAVTFGKIADILQDRGQLEEALRIRREDEFPVHERLGNVLQAVVTKAKIADILRARGQPDEALRIFREQVLPVFDQLGDAPGRAVTIGKIAKALRAKGQVDEAIRLRREEELPIFERLGIGRELVGGRINLVVELLQRNAPGDREEADRLLRLALADARRLKLPEAERIRQLRRAIGLPEA